MLILSWAAAFVACLGYGVGSVLQSIGARRTAGVSGVTGAAGILVQVPYLLGVGADTLGFVANVVALQRLPLFLVQAILTASVGVTAVIAAVRGARLSWRNWTSLAVLGVGLVLLSVSATSDHAVRIGPTVQSAILASAVLPALVGLVGLRLPGRLSSYALAAAAGLAFSGVAVASRGLSSVGLSWAVLASPLLWTIALQGALGLAGFALALQRGDVTAVTAITFMVELVLPAALGLALFGDSVRPGLVAYAGFGFALAVVGTVSLMRFAE